MRLKECREKAGYSQKQVAIMLDVAGPSVSNWERGKTNPTHENLARLAALYHVSVDYLMGMETQPASSDAIRVPVLGTIPAGVPIEAIEDILDWEEIPASMANGGKEYFALQIHGDSMTPTYHDGDVVIIRRQDTCESGQDCAVIVNGSDSTFKRVRRSLDGIVLQPLNSAYTPLVYTNAQIEALPVRILGVAVEIRRKLI